jgi:hypothetical protein
MTKRSLGITSFQFSYQLDGERLPQQDHFRNQDFCFAHGVVHCTIEEVSGGRYPT